MGKDKAAALTSLSKPALLLSILYVVSGVASLWAFSLTGFRMITLPVLAIWGFAASGGLWMKKRWGRWFALFLFVPHVVQAVSLLWSYLLLMGSQLVANSMMLVLLLGAYVIILTLSTYLLLRTKTDSE